MKRTVPLALIVALLTAPSAFAGDALRISPVALEQAPAPDKATEAKALHDDARQWQIWGAVTMASGFVFDLLGETSLATKTNVCTGSFNAVVCTELKDPNLGAVYGGAIVMGLGVGMVIYGAMKESRAKKLAPSLTFGPHSFKLSKTIVFP